MSATERLRLALNDTHRRIHAALDREDERLYEWVAHVEGQCVGGCIHCPVSMGAKIIKA